MANTLEHTAASLACVDTVLGCRFQLLQSVWVLNFKEASKLLAKNHVKYSEPQRLVRNIRMVYPCTNGEGSQLVLTKNRRHAMMQDGSGWNALFWALGPKFGPGGDTPDRFAPVSKR